MSEQASEQLTTSCMSAYLTSAQWNTTPQRTWRSLRHLETSGITIWSLGHSLATAASPSAAKSTGVAQSHTAPEKQGVGHQIQVWSLV